MNGIDYVVNTLMGIRPNEWAAVRMRLQCPVTAHLDHMSTADEIDEFKPRRLTEKRDYKLKSH